MGWLYRCSQDRELLLEEDIDRGTVVSAWSSFIVRKIPDLVAGENG
jgi:hypothetical protein